MVEPAYLNSRNSSLKELVPLDIQLVDSHQHEQLWNDLVTSYHYLSYKWSAGLSLKYLVFSKDLAIAALSWNSGVYKLKNRDDILWRYGLTRSEIPYKVITNSRFLILPWITVPNLASHILSRVIKLVIADWHNRFNHEPVLLETFVDPNYFSGTCYRAANWLFLGYTKGCRKNGKHYTYHGNKKAIFVYPLKATIRTLISTISPPFLTIQQQTRRRIDMLPTIEWNRQLIEIERLDASDLSTLPELLVEFHDEFNNVFCRAGQEESGLYYLSGLLSSIERKNAERIALELLGEKGVRKLQRFMKDNLWHQDQMLAKIQHKTARLLNDPEGMLTVDSSEFTKKGKHSVGVERQYCGRYGKVDNCQSGVFFGYCSDKGYSLIDGQLYLPQSWFSDEKKAQWEKWDIPDDTTFQTKIDIANQRLQTLLNDHTFDVKWIGFDSFFGRDIGLLESLGDDVNFFASIPSDTRVYLEPVACAVPPYKGRGRKPTRMKVVDENQKPITVNHVAELGQLTWHKEQLCEGSKGPVYADMARIRIFISKNNIPGKAYWLFIRRHLDGKETKFYLSNAQPETSFEDMKRAAVMRWSIEQSFKTAKSELGMADYESRSYISWNRHMIYVFLASLFLLSMHDRLKKNATHYHTPGENIDRRHISIEITQY